MIDIGTRFAEMSDGAYVAYQVVGRGPPDLLFLGDNGSNVESAWELPSFARVLGRLASFSQLIRFDHRGSGISELRGEEATGMAVHIGARVSAIAGTGEVLVSSTVRDVVVGSGIKFDDRGEHELKGVPEKLRLFAVDA